jgi:uncharacterized protein
MNEQDLRFMESSIMLASGKYFSYLYPSQCDFDITDIAHALSNLCRFTGHCDTFYSVAQHSVLVSYALPPEFAYQGLMHDAAEAFVGDVASPLKKLLPEYKVIESRVEAAVFTRFGLHLKLDASVKHADRVLLRTEQRDLTLADKHEWTCTKGIEPLPYVIYPLGPSEARTLFLQRYEEVKHQALW